MPKPQTQHRGRPWKAPDPNLPYADLIRAIQDKLVIRNWSYADLQRESSFSRAFIEGRMRGERAFDEDTVKIIGDALGCADMLMDAFHRCDAQKSGVRGVPSAADVGTQKLVVASHKFMPFYMPGEIRPKLKPSGNRSLCSEWTVECYTFPALPAAEVYVMPFNVAVVHCREVVEVESLVELAIWRQASYSEMLNHADAYRHAIIGEAVPVKKCYETYVLSLYYVLRQDLWTSPFTQRAGVGILSTPSILLPFTRYEEQPFVPDAETLRKAKDVELRLLREGLGGDDTVTEFGIADAAVGCASWASVAYSPTSPERALSEDDLVDFEIVVQALWGYCNAIIHSTEVWTDVPTATDAYGEAFLRHAATKLLSAGAREPIQIRRMHEAIVTTSRIQEQMSNAVTRLSDERGRQQ